MPGRDNDAAGDTLARLRSQVDPDSVAAGILAELAVIRAAVSRLVTAISGDPAVGVDGIIVRLKRHDSRLSDVEARVGLVDSQAKTERSVLRAFLRVSGYAGAFTGWALAVWQFLR